MTTAADRPAVRGAGRMRIAWVTPLSSRSAIARYSLAVVRALSVLVDVDVFYPPTGDDLECPWACSTTALGDAEQAPAALQPYDVVLYNLGNNVEYHADIFEHYLRVPGVSILHDKVMQAFFADYGTMVRQDPFFYVRMMSYLYGSQGLELATNVTRNGWTRSLEMLAADRYPLFEPCLFNAVGAVVHSAGAERMVSSRYGDLLPVATIELPTFIYDLDYHGQPLLDRSELDLPEGVVLVVASGRMNSPKRLDVLMRAIGGDTDLKQRVMLVLAGGGDPDYVAALQNLALDQGLSERVRFVIQPHDRLMHSYISAADICVNLRNPSTESGSAALVEQLHFGKPVLVSRVGTYDELPDDVVTKTDVDDEERSIAEGLHRLVFDDGYRAAVASAAAAYAVDHHSPETYARWLVGFLASLPAKDVALRMADGAPFPQAGDRTAESLEQSARRIAREIALRLSDPSAATPSGTPRRGAIVAPVSGLEDEESAS